MTKAHRPTQSILYTSVIAAVAVLAGCGGGGGSAAAPAVMLKGVVASAMFTPGSATDPTVTPAYWQGALVCVDANNNGKCDTNENPVTTSSTGAFTLSVASAAAIIADIGTSATNGGINNSTRNVYRASIDQVKEQGASIVLSPLSTEVVRLMEANGSTYATEKANLATRLSVATTDIPVSY